MGAVTWLSSTSVFKIVALVCILALSLVTGLLPLKVNITATPKRRRLLGHFSYFSAGVFLGAGMLHMMPDAVDDYNTYLTLSHSKATYPTAYLVAALGFVLVWSIGDNSDSDQARMLAVASMSSERAGAAICYVDVEPTSSYAASPSGTLPLVAADTAPASRVSHGGGEVATAAAAGASRYGTCSHAADSASATNPLSPAACCVDTQWHNDGAVPCAPSVQAQGTQGIKDVLLHDHMHKNVSHRHVIFSPNSMLAVVLAVLFSVHSFIAGLALGLQRSNSGGLAISIAIVAHKWIESTVVGTNFAKERVPYRTAVPIIIIYACMTPLGIATGLAILCTAQSEGASAFAVQGLLGAAASGSFLFMSLHQVSARCCAGTSYVMSFHPALDSVLTLASPCQPHSPSPSIPSHAHHCFAYVHCHVMFWLALLT